MANLIKYVRNKNGHPRGVLVAISKNCIGFSLCSKRDKFNKEAGKKIALIRAHSEKAQDRMSVPASIYKEYLDMVDRSVRYFK